MPREQAKDDNPYLISPAHLADRDAISTLHGKLFEQAWDASFIGGFVADPACKVLLARAFRSDHISGFVILQCAADQAEVLSIGVAPDNQRCGVGELLLRAVLDAAVEARMSRVFLEVASDNIAAQKLYAHFGFQQIDTRKNYYRLKDGKFCDALVLSIALTPGQP